MMKQITTTVCATVLMASCCNINNTEQQVNQQVDELYSRMSQPERIAQLRSGYMDELFDAEGNLDTVKCKQLIPYGIGHFSQYASQELVDANFLRKRVAVVQDWLMHHTPNGIPALFHEEVLSGITTFYHFRFVHLRVVTGKIPSTFEPPIGNNRSNPEKH